MIPLHPNDLLSVRGLLNEVQDPLMRELQFRKRIVNDITVQDEFMIFRKIIQEALEVLVKKVLRPDMQIADDDCVLLLLENRIQRIKIPIFACLCSPKKIG